MASRKAIRRRAKRRRGAERDRLRHESLSFSDLTREEFIAAVTHIALRKVQERRAAAAKLGKESEDRFFSAFMRPGLELPSWFYGVRRANAAEDAAGMDGFAITDIGEMPVQIKSSLGGMLRFNEKRPGNNITVLIIWRNFTPDEIVKKAVAKITDKRSVLRNYISQKRKRAP